MSVDHRKINPAWRESYAAMIADGVDPIGAGKTYEWECKTCGARTWTPFCGGVLEWDCACDHDTTGSDGHGIDVHWLFAGHREYVGTPASIEGRKPDEPSARKLHLETCDGTCDGCKWHNGAVERMAS